MAVFTWPWVGLCSVLLSLPVFVSAETTTAEPIPEVIDESPIIRPIFPILPFPTSTTPPPLTPLNLTYWVSFSKRIQPGAPLAVSVYAPFATGPFTLVLDLMDYQGTELQDQQNFTLQASEEVQMVQWNIDEGVEGWSLYVRARAFGGEEFDGFERVYMSYSKRLSVFIQTDKAVYLPGQTVQFRVLAMLPDLKVIDEPMSIVITDPNNNRIAQWLNVTSDDGTGVVQGEMVTSLYPPLGTWTIKASVDGVDESKTFRIEEYELPQFEVLADFPSYGLTTDESFVGKISAKYTFGSPVQGSGRVVVSMSYFYTRSAPLTLEKTFNLNRQGEAEVEFTIQELTDLAYNTTISSSSFWRPNRTTYNINYRSFDFNVTVTDDTTDDVMSTLTSMTFYSRARMLSYLPITPSSYKPGMSVTLYVEVQQPNGEPIVDTTDVTVSFNVTYYTPIASNPKSEQVYYFYYWPRTEENKLFVRNVAVDQNAVAQITIDTEDIPLNASYISVKASVDGADYLAYRTLNPFTSPSKTFLQLELKTSEPKVGGKVKVQARSNVEFGDYTYQVYSRNTLVLSKAVQTTELSTKKNINFKLTSALAPVADVIVFFITENGEVVVDKLSVAVDEISENDVSLEFADTEVKPGKDAKLKIKASPDSTVFLLGVDKAVKLMGTGNDITRDDVMSDLVQYGSGSGFLLRGSWYFPNYATDANSVFQNANAGIITDARIPGRYLDVPQKYRSLFTTTTIAGPTTMGPVNVARPEGPPVAFAGGALEAANFASNGGDAAGPTAVGGGMQEAESPAERLRTFFPETWLWDSVQMKRKKEVLEVKTPDTITTWVVSAFAVHPTMGLTVSQNQAELLTIKRLFVTLDLPYSAVRGEDVCFTALTFNRYEEPIQVAITLAENASAFDSVLITRDLRNIHRIVQVVESTKIRKDLGVMEPDSMVSTTFCLRPRSLGDMPVTVFLEASRPADGLIKTFRIKPEGVERSQAYPVLIEIPAGQGERFSSTVNITLPDNIVNGSVRMTVNLVGDVMGVVAENMEDLLQMPYGCGEQNMVNFAPNTYLIDYLNKTGRLSPPILSKAKNFMVSGYQRQLQYQRDDGSFSAFGDSDKSGSMWLTAFVIKCFVQAADLGSDVITIDARVVNDGVVWMTRYQNKDGSFREPGQVFHQAMQGGSAEGVALAAYVTITLKEAQNRFAAQMSAKETTQVNDALSKAVAYLESELNNINDTYTTCIVAYALSLAGSSRAADAQQKMQQRATVGDAMKYWRGPVEEKQTWYPWYRQTDAISVEMTSYALLTLMLDNRVQEAIPVFRWLNKQRGPKGGFISTQDTVLGVEALSSMAALALGANFSPIDVRVTWRPALPGVTSDAALTIDEQSVLLLQKVELPVQDGQYPNQVCITALSGGQRAFALAEVVVYYNVDSSTAPQAFNAVTTVSNNTVKTFALTTCVSRTSDSDSQSMVVAEIGIPSGYEVQSRLSDFGNASKVDVTEEKVILYYSSLDAVGDCSVLAMKMSRGVVANSKPASVRVYDYYNPDDEFTTYYSLKQFGVCDLEPMYMMCPFAK